MKLLTATLLLLGLSAALASCPNDCSGHGLCNSYSACECMRNWMGADCSERVCLFSRSYIDTPQGDLNADGFLDKPNTKTVILGATKSFWSDAAGNTCDGSGATNCNDLGACCSCAAPGCVSYGTDTTFTHYFGGKTAVDFLGVDQTTPGVERVDVRRADGDAVADVDITAGDIVVAPCADGTATTVTEAVSNSAGVITTITTTNPDCTSTTGASLFTHQPVGVYTPTTATLASTIYPADEYTATDDPYGFVSSCNSLYPGETITHAIKVEVGATDITIPSAFTESLMYVPEFSTSATGATDKYGAAAFNYLESEIVKAYTDGDSMLRMMVCSVSDTLYNTQWSPKKEWERYPDDHAAGKASSDTTAKYDEAHFFKECAGKGQCDRSTGECECYPGWEGTGCIRAACPEGCSGHGFCKRIADVTDTYLGWDAYHSQYCVCESGYEGADCSLRTCPKGHDPIRRGLVDEVQTITLVDHLKLHGPGPDGDGEDASMALVFTDETGDSWVTPSFLIKPKGTPAHGYFTSVGSGARAGGSLGDFVIINPGSGYDPTATVAVVVGQGSGAATVDCSVNGAAVSSSAIGTLIINADGQVTGIDLNVAGEAVTGCFDSGSHAGPIPWAAATVTTPGELTGGAATRFTTSLDPESKQSYLEAAKNIEAALEALPNNVIPDVVVTVDFVNHSTGNVVADPKVEDDDTNAGYLQDARFHITFIENSGDLPSLGVRFGNALTRGPSPVDDNDWETVAATYPQAWLYDGDDTITAGDGNFDTADKHRWSCTKGGNSGPALVEADAYQCTGDAAARGWVSDVLTVTETVAGTKLNEICSRRGLCDYSTGECQCFAGFTDIDCHVQNALSMG